MAELTVDMTYGQALYSAAQDLNKVEVLGEEAAAIQEVFQQEPDFFQLLIFPGISAAEKKNILTTVFEGKVSQEMLNFLYVLINSGRMREYERIVKEYQKLRNREEGKSYGEVYSVEPLSDDQIQKLEEQTAKLLNSNVELENKVDKSLIGGIKILVDGKIIDATLRKRLQNLGTAMR